MIDPRPYLRLTFAEGGRERPAVDCWGLVSLVWREVFGLRIDGYDDGTAPPAIAEAYRSRDTARWLPIEAGAERAGDLVVVRAIVRAGAGRVAIPGHCGVVVDPGRMMDVKERLGVAVRVFRTTERETAHPSLDGRVLAILRPRELAA